MTHASLLRAAALRHAAIVVAAGVAWWMNRPGAPGSGAVLALGGAGIANLAMAFLAEHAVASQFIYVASMAIGVGAWATIVATTGGVASPLVAGFWLEIAAAAFLLGPTRTLVAAGASVVALWAQQALGGRGFAVEPLCVESVFLVGIGSLSSWASHRVARRERVLLAQTQDLTGRLRRLEQDLESAQAVGQIGERAARFAHACKSAVHSLRGFSKLIEAPLLETPTHRKALDGLRLAIDRLDEMTRVTLRPAAAARDTDAGRRSTSSGQVRAAVQDVLDEFGLLYSGVRWIGPTSECTGSVALATNELREVLRALLQNAVEASDADGEVAVSWLQREGMLHISVRDRGHGLSAGTNRLFQRGVTTKPNGSGYGLFLARRTAELAGGCLTGESAEGGGPYSFSACRSVTPDDHDRPDPRGG